MEAFPQLTGIVLQWDQKDIDDRIAAGAGGEYTHHKFGQITISKLSADLYRIEKLSLFDLWDQGWITIIENRKFVELRIQEEPEWLKNM